jgi:hypothetical protein
MRVNSTCQKILVGNERVVAERKAGEVDDPDSVMAFLSADFRLALGRHWRLPIADHSVLESNAA